MGERRGAMTEGGVVVKGSGRDVLMNDCGKDIFLKRNKNCEEKSRSTGFL